jgi:hypothetical protein
MRREAILALGIVLMSLCKGRVQCRNAKLKLEQFGSADALTIWSEQGNGLAFGCMFVQIIDALADLTHCNGSRPDWRARSVAQSPWDAMKKVR